MAENGDDHALYYTSDLVTNLQLRWGEGFLSPGGEQELARMLRDLDLTGQTGLDFGCGIGGYGLAMVENHNVAKIVGIDIDGAKIISAQTVAKNKNLAEKLDYMRVEPGRLPFDDNSFDFCFSKDSIIELPEKAAIFTELYRVTKHGGQIIISDWFRSDEPYSEEMRKWATTGEETYEMDSITSASELMEQAGFSGVETDDRNDWFRSFSLDEYERLKGPLYAVYVEKFGEDQAKSSVENARIRHLLADQGQLRPGHIRARK